MRTTPPPARGWQTISDVDTSQVGDAPAGWTTPAGGGLHLISDYQHDARGRLIEELGPWHTVDLNGIATPVRTARWMVYQDAEHEVWIAQGYATGTAPDYTYTLVNPVSITRSDRNGNVLEQIQAVRAGTAGKLQPSDSFPQSSYVRRTTYQYTDCCLLGSAARPSMARMTRCRALPGNRLIAWNSPGST